MACSAASSAPAICWRAFMASISARFCGPKTLEEQRAVFDKQLAPLIDKRFVRWLTRQPASLYGLGIPPSQYRALSGDSPEGIAAVLKQRVERLACGFPVGDNYFAWQAFGRRYAPDANPSVPPYLQRENFEAVAHARRSRAAAVMAR